MTRFGLREAARRVRAGAVIAYPTEAVYGLGCDPLNPGAVYRLLALKQRPVEKGLILVADRVERLLPYVRFDEDWAEPVLASWPGPHTWLLPAADALPYWINGGRDTLACRVSAHPLVTALCAELRYPLVSTSANLAGRPPARSALQVRLRCPGTDMILHGPLGGLARPTPIRDARSGASLRL